MEDEWTEFVVPLVLLLVFPAIFVYLGYLTYGLFTRNMDLTVVWLLSVYFAVLTVLQVVTIVAAPAEVSFATWLRFRGVEVFGLIATIAGWAASSAFRPLSK
jgi:hypothetical protein